LIIAMVSVVAILVLQALGTSTRNIYEHVNEQVDEANKYSEETGGSGSTGPTTTGGSSTG